MFLCHRNFHFAPCFLLYIPLVQKLSVILQHLLFGHLHHLHLYIRSLPIVIMSDFRRLFKVLRWHKLQDFFDYQPQSKFIIQNGILSRLQLHWILPMEPSATICYFYTLVDNKSQFNCLLSFSKAVCSFSDSSIQFTVNMLFSLNLWQLIHRQLHYFPFFYTFIPPQPALFPSPKSQIVLHVSREQHFQKIQIIFGDYINFFLQLLHWKFCHKYTIWIPQIFCK